MVAAALLHHKLSLVKAIDDALQTRMTPVYANRAFYCIFMDEGDIVKENEPTIFLTTPSMSEPSCFSARFYDHPTMDGPT
jgi:hypothetical protein